MKEKRYSMKECLKEFFEENNPGCIKDDYSNEHGKIDSFFEHIDLKDEWNELKKEIGKKGWNRQAKDCFIMLMKERDGILTYHNGTGFIKFYEQPGFFLKDLTDAVVDVFKNSNNDELKREVIGSYRLTGEPGELKKLDRFMLGLLKKKWRLMKNRKKRRLMIY